MRSIFLHTAVVISLIGGQLFSQSSIQASIGRYSLSVFFINYQEAVSAGTNSSGINLSYLSRGKVTRVRAKESALTRDLNYVGPSKFSFVKEITKPDGTVTYAPLVSANLGAKGRKCIVLIRDPNGRLVSKVFDISGAEFAENTVRCINLSRNSIRAKVGSRINDLSSMDAIDFEVSGKSQKFLVPFILATVNQGAKPVIIENGRLTIRQGGRILVLLYHDPKDLSNVRYRRIALTKQLQFEETAVDLDAVRNAEKSLGL